MFTNKVAVATGGAKRNGSKALRRIAAEKPESANLSNRGGFME